MLSIGLMSGTSMDGIDAALLETDGESIILELGHVKLSYATETQILLKAAERALKQTQGDLQQANEYYLPSLYAYLQCELVLSADQCDSKMSHLKSYLQINGNALNLLGVIHHSTQLHIQAVKRLLAKTHHKACEITVIGYHGQTLFHNPPSKITVQIGDGAYMANTMGISVVNDFRRQDIMAGGQGAPFAPIYHQALAIRDKKIPLAVVNCGGIANITLIMGAHWDALIGFDTGPGNGLIDALVRQRTRGAVCMDFNGQYGASGRVHTKVLNALFEKSIPTSNTNFFQLTPPKALDIRDMLLVPELDALSLEDACATLEFFTAKMIVDSLQNVLTPKAMPQHWILSGGGWHNPVIKKSLQAQLQQKLGAMVNIQTAEEAGWNSDALEAQIFAYLAVRSLKGLPLSLPKTTGVPHPMLGGQLHRYYS